MGIAHRDRAEPEMLLLNIKRVPAIDRFQFDRDFLRVKFRCTHINPNHGVIQAFNFYRTGRAAESELTIGCFASHIQAVTQAADAVSTLLGTAAV